VAVRMEPSTSCFARPDWVVECSCCTDRRVCRGSDRFAVVNLALVTLIAEYCDWTEREAEGLLLHLKINGWTIVPIPEQEDVNG
jgi:hypothetical protein